METEKKIYKKNNNIVSRVIAGETILVPVKNRIQDLDNIYTLNETGSAIWGLIDGDKSFEKILDVIVDEFDIDRRDARMDLEDFFKDMKEINAIQSV